MKIAVLPGDGVGHEIIPEAVKVLQATAKGHFELELEYGHIGMTGVHATGKPLPDETYALAKRADAILFGAIGGPEYEQWIRTNKVRSGLLQLRLNLGLNANLRPVKLFPELANVSTLKPQVIEGLDLLILRELSSDIYFGEPRGPVQNASGERESINTMRYTESQIRAIGHVAFKTARHRRSKVCSVDKANVLETMQLWRDVMKEVGAEYPDVELTHLYVDAAAMMLMRAPTRFDVIVTGNMFGDILSDEAAGLVGGLGMAPGLCIGDGDKVMAQATHGSAPDIAGKGIANPYSMIESTRMLFDWLGYSRDIPEMVAMAKSISEATTKALSDPNARTGDINGKGNTASMANAVLKALI